jgi:hypothetical protein
MKRSAVFISTPISFEEQTCTGLPMATGIYAQIPTVILCDKANMEFSNGVNGTSNGVNGRSNGVHHAMNGTAKNSSRADLPVYRALDGCNVGFQNWHPVPVTPNGDKLAGQGDLGGVWEWTSTPLTEYEGFQAMDIYPGYTCKYCITPFMSYMLTETLADFFDGKHNIIQGGSWATMPRIAGRTTL